MRGIISNLKIEHMRYLAIPVIALILSHLVAYGKMPWDPDYQFPRLGFLVILAVSLGVCETNYLNYGRVLRRNPLFSDPIKNALRVIGSNLALTTVIFLVLTVALNLVIWGSVLSITKLLSYIFISWLISLVETLIFIAWDAYKLYKKKGNNNGTWKLTSGKKITFVDIKEVAYLFSSNGLVYVVKDDATKVLTNFSSLAEMAEHFDLGEFFRINRQYMIKASAVKDISQETNRKLAISLSPPPTNSGLVTVSRYKNRHFREWISSLR